MCCDNKFLFFMNVKTGSLVFAWIGAVLSGAGTLGSFIGNMITIILLLTDGQSSTVGYMFTSTLLLYFGTGFAASVLLLIGIIHRKPLAIKIYIIYGMAVAVLYVILVIIFECVTYVFFVARIFGILGLFVYASILYLHYLTYKQLMKANSNGYVVPSEEVLSI